MSDIKISSINIQISDNKELKLTLEQAEKLYNELGTLFKEKQTYEPIIPNYPIPRTSEPYQPYQPTSPNVPWLTDVWYDRNTTVPTITKYHDDGAISGDVQVTASYSNGRDLNIKL